VKAEQDHQSASPQRSEVSSIGEMWPAASLPATALAPQDSAVIDQEQVGAQDQRVRLSVVFEAGCEAAKRRL
jgi:hypothetical protein